MSNPTCTPEACQNKGPQGGLCKRCQADRALLSYYANREARNDYNRAYRVPRATRRAPRVLPEAQGGQPRRRDGVPAGVAQA